MACCRCGLGSWRGEGELGAMVPVVLRRPHQQVGPAHPRQEVGIPTRRYQRRSNFDPLALVTGRIPVAVATPTRSEGVRGNQGCRWRLRRLRQALREGLRPGEAEHNRRCPGAGRHRPTPNRNNARDELHRAGSDSRLCRSAMQAHGQALDRKCLRPGRCPFKPTLCAVSRTRTVWRFPTSRLE